MELNLRIDSNSQAVRVEDTLGCPVELVMRAWKLFLNRVFVRYIELVLVPSLCYERRGLDSYNWGNSLWENYVWLSGLQMYCYIRNCWDVQIIHFKTVLYSHLMKKLKLRLWPSTWWVRWRENQTIELSEWRELLQIVSLIYGLRNLITICNTNLGHCATNVFIFFASDVIFTFVYHAILTLPYYSQSLPS